MSQNACGFNRLNISILSKSSDKYTSHSCTLSLHKWQLFHGYKWKGVNLSIGVHTERCSICRTWSSVRLLIWSESAWSMLEDARTSGTFQVLSPRFPTQQLHPEHHPPPLTSDTSCYLPFVWCYVRRDRCYTRISCTSALPRRLTRSRRLDRTEACYHALKKQNPVSFWTIKQH